MGFGRGVDPNPVKIKYAIGDLVEYKFRTREGDEPRIGLVVAHSALLGANVWEVQGLDGKEYRIHGEFMTPINERKQ